MVQIFPVRSPTVPPATHTNCYRVGDTVIDPASPWSDEQERLAAALAAGGEVKKILLTHHHADHIGGVEDLARRTGAEVWAHRDAQVPFPVDRRLHGGEVIDTGSFRLRAISTPGHADGHLCFALEGADAVICGDMVAGEGTILLQPPEGHLATYLDSLQRLRQAGTVLYPAHGPAISDGPGLIELYTNHRHARTRQIRAALESRNRVGTASSLANVIYRDIPGVNLVFASAQVKAHLIWMEEMGMGFFEGDTFHLRDGLAITPLD